MTRLLSSIAGNIISGATGPIGATGSTGPTGATGALPLTTPFTANSVVYSSSTSALVTGSTLTFNGTNLGIGTSSPAYKLDVKTADTTSYGINIANSNGHNGSIGFSADYQFDVNAGGAGGNWLNLKGGATGSSGGITFYTNGAEQMRINSSGYLGVGMSSPQSHISVNAIGSTVGLTGDAALRIAPSGTGSTDQIVFGYSESGGYSSGVIGYVCTDYSVYQKGALFFATRGVTTNTAPTERMRIDSSGNVLIGTTTVVDGNGAALVINTSYPKTRIEIRNDGEASGLYAITFRNSNGLVGSIVTNGSATSYNTSSDYRLKNTIAPMTGALAKVALLKPVTYKWNVDGSDSQGFIAHELQAVVPECVHGSKDEVDADGKPQYQGIDTSFLVATLTSAIQELNTTIQSMTARLTALENNK